MLSLLFSAVFCLFLSLDSWHSSQCDAWCCPNSQLRMTDTFVCIHNTLNSFDSSLPQNFSVKNDNVMLWRHACRCPTNFDSLQSLASRHRLLVHMNWMWWTFANFSPVQTTIQKTLNVYRNQRSKGTLFFCANKTERNES